jgi:hypothetical protein
MQEFFRPREEKEKKRMGETYRQDRIDTEEHCRFIFQTERTAPKLPNGKLNHVLWLMCLGNCGTVGPPLAV